MRFLLMTQPYEKTVASGTYDYQFLNRPIDWIEQWRLSDAMDGYRFLRIDEDARGSDGISTLYHAVLNGEGNFENIKFRFWGQGPAVAEKRIEGQLLFEDDHLLLIRTVGDERFEEEIENRYPFVLQGASGLNYMLYWQNLVAAETVLTFNKSFQIEEAPFSIKRGDDDSLTYVNLGDSDIVLTSHANGLAQIVDWTEGDLLAEGKRLFLK